MVFQVDKTFGKGQENGGAYRRVGRLILLSSFPQLENSCAILISAVRRFCCIIVRSFYGVENNVNNVKYFVPVNAGRIAFGECLVTCAIVSFSRQDLMNNF